MMSNDNRDLLLSAISNGTPEEIVDRYASLPEKAKRSSFGEFDSNIVIIDTETTGVSFNHDELTQIAAARVENGEICDWYITFVNPGKPIPEDVSHLTNIRDEDVADAPTPEEALSQLVEFVGDAKLVAHNAEFDKTFATRHPAGYPLLENIWIDSLDLSRIALPRMKSHRLIDLVTAFGGPRSTHRADDDVAATCSVLRVLLAAVDSMPLSLVKKIGEMASAEEWPTGVVFRYLAAEKEKKQFDELQASETPDENEGRLFSGAERFSLSRLRRPRVGRLERRSRKDALDADKEGVAPLPDENEGRLFSGAERFSLSRLRRPRVGRLERRSRKDALDADKEGVAPLIFPSAKGVVEAFGPDGIVGSMYEQYEPREEQLEMALGVRKSFETSLNLMVEAGTGVGKSMAYLVPSSMLAYDNEVTVGVATKTNALLDQLIYKELPLLSAALKESGYTKEGKDLTFASLKGFSHYPCLRKVKSLVDEGPGNKLVGNIEKSQAPALAALLSFIEQTEYEDMDGLKIDYRLLPRKTIATTSKDCLRRKCPFYGAECFVHGSRRKAEAVDVVVTNHSLLFCDMAADGGLLPPVRYWTIDEAAECFVHGSRRKAEAVDVVVTNHSLLFCDMAADGGLLPPVRYWTIDEAHNAENEARRALSVDISADDLAALARRVSAGEGSRGVFGRVERNVTPAGGEDAETLFYALLNKAKNAGVEFAQQESAFVEQMRALLYFDPVKRGKGYENVEIWINSDIRASSAFKSLKECGTTLVERSEKLISACQDLASYLEDVENAAVVQREVAVVAVELKELVKACEIILFEGSDTFVYSAHLCRRAEKGGDKLEALPYNVGSMLNEAFYENTKSVVFASATLSVDGSFDPFSNAMGLNQGDTSECESLQLDSSYDFDRNMTIYVAKDMPEPQDPQYLKRLQDLLKRAHVAQNGSMLTLFTNRKEMERCFDEVQPALKQADLRLICQKWGVSVKGLRDDFIADEHLSLFALKSFWEGFDAPGATLKGVVIPKLPFSKPTDPLSCERAARDDYAWRRYVLPAAILETKQAAGRLIRRADDSGILILADKRLVSKGYGKAFLRSMPSSNIKICTIDEIIEDITR